MTCGDDPILSVTGVEWHWHGELSGRKKSAHVVKRGGEVLVNANRDVLMRMTGLSLKQVKAAFRVLIRDGLVERLSGGSLIRVRARVSAQKCHGTKIFATMVRMVGSVESAMLLSQLHFWFLDGKFGRTKLSQHFGGHWWVAKQIGELAGELGLSEMETKNALGRLRQLKLIETVTRIFAGQRCLYLRLCEAECLARWKAVSLEVGK